MTEQKPPVDLPADPKLWTEAECDEALRRIVDHDLAIAAARLKYNGRMARAKADFDAIQKQHDGGKKALVAQLRAAGQRLKTGWKDKSIKLFWGTIGFRRPAPKLKPAKGATWESVMAEVKARRIHNGIQITETLNLEVLERLKPETFKAVGLDWTSPGENFSHKTKLEIDAEQTGDTRK